MIAYSIQYFWLKIRSMIGSGNMKQIETLITKEKPKSRKTKSMTSHKK